MYMCVCMCVCVCVHVCMYVCMYACVCVCVCVYVCMCFANSVLSGGAREGWSPRARIDFVMA